MKKNLLLIHGTWQTDEFWNEAIPEFERLGYTVHAPVLRYHDLPLMEGAEKIASLSLLDYTQDLVDFAETLDTPPLIIGHSLGGLLAQLVACRTKHLGIVAACPAPPAGIFAWYPKVLLTFSSYFMQWRPWAKPMMPIWEKYRSAGASLQPENEARERFKGLVAESGRAYCELVFPFLDRQKAALVDFGSINTPVLAIGAQFDAVIHPNIPRTTARKYNKGSFVEIADSDHMLFFGQAMRPAVDAIETWINKENIFV